MLCRPNLFGQELDKRKPPVVDLEGIVFQAAWKGLRVPSCCGCRKNPCKKKGLYLKADWNFMQHRDTVHSFDLVPGDVSIRPVQLYKTEFRNFSGEEQTFTFHAQRQTESQMEMTVTEGVSIGGNFEMNFSLPEPPVTCAKDAGGDEGGKFGLAGAMVGGEIVWNKEVTDRYQKTETMNWGVDSAVKLDHGKRALASLSVLEAKLNGTIRVRTEVKFTADSGLLPVDVITKKGKEVIATVEVSAKSICKANKDFELGADKRSFTYYTTISCKAVYGVEQVATVQLLGPGEGADMIMEAPALRGAPPALTENSNVTIKEIDSDSVLPILSKA